MQHETKTMPTNRISQILRNQGFENVRPTDNLLSHLGLTIHQFNRIVENKAQPTTAQMLAFKSWLKLDSIDELFNA